ncbi:MAG: RNA methyltransferase [Gammaproteobacteria bacterium]|nr:RNA methyltransferase [Gammaproteobacteria bacterium]
MVDKIRIVMVETTHPGNIGAAARAMKTMGHKRLYLVKPKVFPSAEVTARAAGADDILANAVVCNSLQEAVKDCVLVVATSARQRSIPWQNHGPRECAGRIIDAAESGQVALVFGRESSGLDNDELEFCNSVVQIPTNPQFSSLNVASAIQILCYEIMQAANETIEDASREENKIPLASTEQMRLFYEHLEQCMTEIGFYDPGKPRRLMRRLKRLFNRVQLDQNEINILRGFFVAAQDAARKNKK